MDAACQLIERYIYHSARKIMKHFNVSMEYGKVNSFQGAHHATSFPHETDKLLWLH
jgi:hypothetical protein